VHKPCAWVDRHYETTIDNREPIINQQQRDSANLRALGFVRRRLRVTRAWTHRRFHFATNGPTRRTTRCTLCRMGAIAEIRRVRKRAGALSATPIGLSHHGEVGSIQQRFFTEHPLGQ
jgi:hypothetical protein